MSTSTFVQVRPVATIHDRFDPDQNADTVTFRNGEATGALPDGMVRAQLLST